MSRIFILFVLIAHCFLAAAQVPAVSIITDRTAICAGIANNFYATSTHVGTGVIYNWKVNGTQSGPNSSIFSSSTLNEGDKISCTISSTGNFAYPTANSNVIIATAGNTQIPELSIMQTAGNTCSATFEATAINAGTAPLYKWTVNGIDQGVNAARFIDNHPNANDKITCTLTNTNTCAAINSVTKSIVLTATQLAAKLIITAIPGAEGCDDTPVVFMVSADPGSAGAIYDWYQNGQFKGRLTDAAKSMAFNLKDGDIIQCKIPNPDPCVAGGIIASNEIRVRMDRPPVVTITADKERICTGSPVTFTAVADPAKNPTYQWKVNGNTLSGERSKKFISTTLKNGDLVTCTVINESWCKAPATSNGILVIVNDLPLITLPGDVYISAGQQVQLTPQITGGVVGYQWSPASGLSSAMVANPTANPAQTTTYQLTVTTAAGCTASALVTVRVGIVLNPKTVFTPNGDGINDNWSIPELAAFPDCAVQIFDRGGRMIYRSVGYGQPWDGTINGRQLAAGTYYYVIDTKRSVTRFTGTVTVIR